MLTHVDTSIDVLLKHSTLVGSGGLPGDDQDPCKGNGLLTSGMGGFGFYGSAPFIGILYQLEYESVRRVQQHWR